MKRWNKWIWWGLGVLLLIFLIMYIKNTNFWEAWALPLTGKTIVLDAGHGG